MNEKSELTQLLAQIRACRICSDAPFLGPPLPHEPRPVVVASSRSPILIAGQAPGTRVHASGMPFTDRSGDRLREWLGVTYEEFYEPDNFAIVPMGFCFPGQDARGSDLPPRRECAITWRERLMELMPQVELILVIGQYAQAWHMSEDRKGSLAETVANWRAVFSRNEKPRVLPLPHPSWRNTAWLKRNPWFSEELLPVLRAEISMRLIRRS
ncbi:uracil-DNA glycosylase family protein [Aquamicrobium zhengzhouense]|uniref:Uracil-DNA glycosylase family protein n=1 Tax=Aquamicrobium zhengzhouense TaxID=2781738 RepID=A0ABS0SD73_9HYPH|nr:uracil-DNA glycosylase family protein [Aquamicrobium zhengzhouense]MBI1620651.1 uracil-DNA glycosylase family protein [Aquamicrobium zhengzhouense]